jgi:hypothetical protein
MFDSVRRERLAPWIVLAGLIVLSVLLLVIILVASSEREQVYQQYATSQAYAEAQERFKTECYGLTTIEEIRKCFELIIKNTREPQRAEEDLSAQKQMARWAELMTYITLGIGIATVSVASISAYFFVQSNSLNRQALIASHRAWMKLTRNEIQSSLTWIKDEQGYDVGKIEIDFDVSNIGKSPALNVWLDVESYAGFFAANEGYVRYQRLARKALAKPRHPGIGNTVFPEDRIWIRYELSIHPEAKAVGDGGKEIEMPMTTLLVVGCVTYGLFIGKEWRQTGFALTIKDMDSNRLLRSIGPERAEVPAENLKFIRGFGDDTFAD